MKLDLAPIGIAGYYKIEAHQETEAGVQHSHRTVADWFPNLITNGGLEMIKSTGFLNSCQIGAGTTAPAFGDTALQTRIAGVAAANPGAFTTTASSSSPYYSETVATYVFPQGAAAGNLSEIGISVTPTSALFSRARILDGVGAPTTITVLAIEVLTVTYAFRMYRSEADVVGSFIVGGTTYTTTSRPARINDPNPAFITNYYGLAGTSSRFGTSASGIGPITGSIPFSGVADGSRGAPVFGGSGQYWMDRVFNFTIAQGNEVGGVASVSDYRTDNLGINTQVGFSPVLPKDNTRTMAITLRTTWGRYP